MNGTPIAASTISFLISVTTVLSRCPPSRYGKMAERKHENACAFAPESLFILLEQNFVNHRKHHHAVRGQAPV
jgi:hypothetical protein